MSRKKEERGFLPPAALQSEVNRTRVLLQQAEKEHARAVQSLESAQARVEHARGALASKAAARDAAVQHRADTETELQVAKYFSQHFTAVWERKEEELAKSATAVHRSEVDLKQANTAVEGVKKHAVTALEVKEDADKQLDRARRAFEKAKRKAEEAAEKARVEEAADRGQHDGDDTGAHTAAEALKQAATAVPAGATPAPVLLGAGIPGVVTAEQLRQLQGVAAAGLAATGGIPPTLLASYPVAAHAAIMAAITPGVAPVAVAAAPAAPAATLEVGAKASGAAAEAAGGTPKAANGATKRGRSRSRSGSRERRRHRAGSRSRSRSRERRHGGRRSRSHSRERRHSRSRERRRSSRERRRSRSRDKEEREKGKEREKERDKEKEKERRRSRSKEAKEERRSGRSRSRERERTSGRQVDLSKVEIPSAVYEAFKRALVDSFLSKRPPFNVSLINDHMRKLDKRWNAPRALGITFSQFCEIMERRGVMEVRRAPELTEVVGSSYAEAKLATAGVTAGSAGGSARRRSRSPPRRRSRSPARPAARPAHSPQRFRSRSPAGRGDGERWEMGT